MQQISPQKVAVAKTKGETVVHLLPKQQGEREVDDKD
jgi:hypothetical protein